MGADLRWWQDTSLLATADALSFVTTDLLERMGFPESLGPESNSEIDPVLESLEQARERTVDRLASIAERLADAGDIERAFALDTKVDAFHSDTGMAAYMPDLGEFKTREDVSLFGPRTLSQVRLEVAWLVDQLRPDRVTVNEYGVPTKLGAPDAAEYRWGPLLGAGDDPSTAWAERFASGSWVRRIFETAAGELPAMFGLGASERPRRNE
jgi:hypothetical protein